MPFRNYTQFDVDTLRLMTAAYDAAVAKLGLPNADPRTGKLASAIVSLVAAGERDQETLTKKAVVALGAMGRAASWLNLPKPGQ
jgi:hypothetical protein